MLECDELRVSVPGRTLVADLDFALSPGEFVAVLGRNGTGKTLSLLTFAGLRAPDAGKVLLASEDIAGMPRQQVARLLALLPQDTEDVFPATVLDTTLVGRHPHIGRWRWESADDINSARHALAAVGIDDLESRDVLSLSGGERRRLAIAQVVTQEPLASRFADRCLLLFGDGRWETGATNELLNEARLEALYETPMEALQWRDRQLFVAAD